MAIKGQLWLDGAKDTYTVVECEYKLKQEVNENNGLPISGVTASAITLTIVTPDTGNVFYEWMINEFAFKNGCIALITNVNSGGSSKRLIYFENAKCVALVDYFNNHNSSMMTTTLKIQPGRIIFQENAQRSGAGAASCIGYDFRKKRKVLTSARNAFEGWQERRRDDERAVINSWK